MRFILHLIASALCLLSLAAPLTAQVEHPRQFPTEASFLETVGSLRASSGDGFAPHRGERRDAEYWTAVCPEGLTPDDATDPSEARHRVWASEVLGKFVLTFTFERKHAPTDAEAAAMEADFRTLRGWLLEAGGDWEFATKTTDAGLRTAELVSPGGTSKVRLNLQRMEKDSQRTWWTITLVATTPMDELPPLEPKPVVAPRFPTEAGFSAVVEAMKAGAYDGLEPLKGLIAPQRNQDRWGGFMAWGVMTMEGLGVDPEADRYSMASLGRTGRDTGLTVASYPLGSYADPSPERKAQLEADFVLLRSWLAKHTAGWATTEEFDPWYGRTAESRRFALVPLPGMEVRRVDGEAVPRIELSLRKRVPKEGPETWSLTLSCDAQGEPKYEPGTGDWILDMLAESDPAVELPAMPANLEETVLALVADAPNSFAAFTASGEPTELDPATFQRRIDDPIIVPFGAFQPLTVHLVDAPDPAGVRDCVTSREDRWSDEASATLGLISIHDPNALTQRAIDARLEEVVERLSAALPGWRKRLVDVPGGRYEDFKVRIGLLEGVRADGHPIWIGVERMRYPMSVVGYPEADTMQLSLYVKTDHKEVLGYDMLGQWRAALAEEKQPLTSAVRILGDPLEGLLRETDRVLPTVFGPIDLVELFGLDGQDEVVLDVIRDGRFEELVITPPRLTLERWRELQAECDRDELSPSALSLVGSRLPTAELAELLRGTIAAGEADFAELPAAYADWLVRNDDRELATIAIPLWDAVDAPTPTFVDNLRASLEHSLDWRWIVEPESRNSGPFWDWFARQTHWSARHEGPRGVHPWVELVEGRRDERVFVELQVHAFSSAHRAANAEHPKRLWFQPIGGDCVNGRGVAYCYREGLTFDGPFVDGLAHGVGEHIFADGTALVNVNYEHGDMRYMGHAPPPPPLPPSPSIYNLRGDYGFDLSGSAEPSTWQDDWFGTVPTDFIDPAPVFQEWGDGGSYATCVNCNGSGEEWHTYEIEEYDDTMVLSGTGLWNQGYDTIRTSYGTRKVSEIGPCYSCNGTGRQRY